MTDKPEKITAGRLLLERHHDMARLYNTNNNKSVEASWSEFQKLARGILKDEIDELYDLRRVMDLM